MKKIKEEKEECRRIEKYEFRLEWKGRGEKKELRK
jgi:hypothetical protein